MAITLKRAALITGIFLASMAAAQAPPTTGKSDEAPAASRISVEWQSVTMNFTRVNPALSAAKQNGMQDSQVMSINGTVTLNDTTNVVGIEQFGGVLDISKIVDDEGNDFTFLINGNRPDRWYGPLSYQPQYDADARGMTEKLQPSQFGIGLKANVHLPARFARVEGQVRLLMCDSIKHVDLPYTANGPAVEVMPGVRVHFASATKDANRYNYQLVCDPANGAGFDGRISADHPLASQAVVDQSLIDSAGKAIQQRGGRFGSFQSQLSTNASGGMSGSDKIDAIRFDVAIGLHEVSIPVVLKNIDLPQIGMVSAVMPSDPASVPAIDRVEQELARRLSDARDRSAQNGWSDEKDKLVRSLWKSYKADYEAGVSKSVSCAPVLGMTPDVKSYYEYVGKYRLNPPAKAHAQPLDCSIEKDDHGRLTLTIGGPGRTLPLAGRDGALLGVFDPIFKASDPLDPKSDPKLAGIWIVKFGGKLTVLTDTGRPEPAIPLEPATQPAP